MRIATLPHLEASFERPFCRDRRSNSHQILIAIDEEFDAPVGDYKKFNLHIKSESQSRGN